MITDTRQGTERLERPQTVNVVNRVKIERTQFFNQILKFLQIDDDDDKKNEWTRRHKIIFGLGRLIVKFVIFMVCVLVRYQFYDGSLYVVDEPRALGIESVSQQASYGRILFSATLF